MNLLLIFITCAVSGTEPDITLERSEVTPNGVVNYWVSSPYQRKTNVIQVLLPDEMGEGREYPVLYILPVNDGTDGEWGSGIDEAKRADVHNLYDVICVAPAYDETPWFGDHPSDPSLRQESYLYKAVMPFIESRYPVRKGREGRLLIGFSKSGFGAMAMFLRHLDETGKAAVWDAPLTGKTIFKGEDEMLAVFATEENYRRYYIPGLIERHAQELKRGPSRIVLVNNGDRPGSVPEIHRQLTSLEIHHRYLSDERRKHDWRSGWFAVAAKLLFEDGPR